MRSDGTRSCFKGIIRLNCVPGNGQTIVLSLQSSPDGSGFFVIVRFEGLSENRMRSSTVPFIVVPLVRYLACFPVLGEGDHFCAWEVVAVPAGIDLPLAEPPASFPGLMAPPRTPAVISMHSGGRFASV